MLIDIFGKIEYVHELHNSIAIEGDRLYVFLKQFSKDGKAYYEYLGSMMSTLEDTTTAFMSAFLDIATHYALPSAPLDDLLNLKKQLDDHDRRLIFEGKASV